MLGKRGVKKIYVPAFLENYLLDFRKILLTPQTNFWVNLPILRIKNVHTGLPTKDETSETKFYEMNLVCIFTFTFRLDLKNILKPYQPIHICILLKVSCRY